MRLGKVAVLFVLWAVFSSITDALNKSILNPKVLPLPISLTLVQFFVSGVLATIADSLFSGAAKAGNNNNNNNSGKKTSTNGTTAAAAADKRSTLTWTRLGMIALAQGLGFYLTNVSFGATAVSFTHTVKATMPLMSMLLSFLFLRERFSTSVMLSVLPIVGGVILCSASQGAFSLEGLISALASNVCFASRDLLAKSAFAGRSEVEVYKMLSWAAAALLFPFWLVFDASAAFAAFAALSDSVRSTLLVQLAVNTAMHWAYNQVSFLMLGEVVPLTHSLLNVGRRMVVIVATIFYFGNSPSPANLAGIGAVFAGVCAYSWVKSREAKAKAKTQ